MKEKSNNKFIVDIFSGMPADKFLEFIKSRSDRELADFYWDAHSEFVTTQRFIDSFADLIPKYKAGPKREDKRRAKRIFGKNEKVTFEYLLDIYDRSQTALLLLSERIELAGMEGLKRKIFTVKDLGLEDDPAYQNVSPEYQNFS